MGLATFRFSPITWTMATYLDRQKTALRDLRSHEQARTAGIRLMAPPANSSNSRSTLNVREARGAHEVRLLLMLLRWWWSWSTGGGGGERGLIWTKFFSAKHTVR